MEKRGEFSIRTVESEKEREVRLGPFLPYGSAGFLEFEIVEETEGPNCLAKMGKESSFLTSN